MSNIADILVEHILMGDFNGKTEQSEWECSNSQCNLLIKTDGPVPDKEFAGHLEEILKAAGFAHKDKHEKIFIHEHLAEYKLRHGRMDKEIARLRKLPRVPEDFVAKYFAYQVQLRSLIARMEVRLKALTTAQ
jgi:hypothetical protein